MSQSAIRAERDKVELERAKLQLGFAKRKEKRLEAEDKAAEESGGQFEPTTGALARRFGIGINTITGMLKEPEAPKRHGPKGYRVAEWGAYLLKRRRETDGVLRLNALREDAEREKVRARKMANDAKAGKVVAVERVAKWARRFSQEVADAIASVRERAAMRGADAILLKSAEEMSQEVKHIIATGLEAWRD